MNIDGGGLHFESDLDNDKINAAIEETLRRIQGLSDGTVGAGNVIDEAFEQIAEAANESGADVSGAIDNMKSEINKSFQQIDQTFDANQAALAELEAEYERLGKVMGDTFMAGKDTDYRQARDRQQIVAGEISVRKKLQKELSEEADKLSAVEKKIDDYKVKVEKAAVSQTSFRTQLREAREELIRMEQAGLRGTSAYDEMQKKVGQLQDAYDDAAAQARILANDQAAFQGVISGVSGVSGAFSAATGTVSLFAGESENLQKVMTKVQSVMAITIGLQQVSATLNKDSAFSLVTLNKLKEWWAGVVVKSGVATKVETVATIENTVAKTANAAATAQGAAIKTADTAATIAQASAAKAGTLANIGLAGAFRLVGTAIKSIPLFGWILTGISGLVALYRSFTKEAREAKKRQDEFYKSVTEGAYKPIGVIHELSAKWNKLGDDMEAKKKFIDDNKSAFEKLGQTVRDVADAQKLLIDNKDDFIQAQIAKAKSLALTEIADKDVQDAVNARLALEDEKKKAKVTRYVSGGMFGGGYAYEIDNPAIEKQQKKLEEANAKIKEKYEQVIVYDKEYSDAIDKLNEENIKKYAGTVVALKKQIEEKNKAIETMSDRKEIEATQKEIESIQHQIDKLLGNTEKKDSKSTVKDPLIEKIEKRKQEYAQYFKWVENGLQKEAETMFAETMKGGQNYMAYLNRMKDDSSLTQEQLRHILNEIASETDKSMLDTFKESLSNQLQSAKTVIEQLKVIQQMRDELKDDDPLKAQKVEILDDTDKNTEKQRKQETERVLSEYADVNDRKLDIQRQYFNDIELLNRQREQSISDDERQRIDRTIAYRKQRYNDDVQNLLRAQTESQIRLSELERDKTILEISRKKYLWETDRKKEIFDAEKKALETTLSLLKKLQMSAPTIELAEEIERVAFEVDKLNVEIEKLPVEKFQEMLSGLQKITSALSGLDGELGEMFSSISGQVENIKASFDETASTTDKVSAGISGLVGIINMLTSASAKRKEVEKQYYQNQIALAHEYALALNNIIRTQSEMSGGGFVTDYAGRINDSFKAMTDATEKYQEAIKKLSDGKAKVSLRNAVDWGNVGKGLGAGAAAGAAIGSIVPVVGTAVGAVAGAIIGGIAGLFGGKKKKEDYGGLLDVFPELVDGAGKLNKELAQTIINTNQVDDKTKQLIQNAIEWADAIDESRKQMGEIVKELAGDLENGIKKALDDAFRDGKKAQIGLFDEANKSLEKFIDNLIYGLMFSKYFDEFKKNLDDAMEDDGILDEKKTIHAYDKLMKGVEVGSTGYFEALEAIKKRAKERGFDLWKSDAEKANTSLTGSVKSVTEETASLVAGQMNAIRINQMEATAIIRQQLLHLSNIDRNTISIDENTRYIRLIYNKMEPADPLRADGLS